MKAKKNVIQFVQYLDLIPKTIYMIQKKERNMNIVLNLDENHRKLHK
jgi:hypothetical protein